jgi:hypothetical protein
MQKSKLFQSPQANPDNFRNNKPTKTKTLDRKPRPIYSNLDTERRMRMQNKHKSPSAYKMVSLSRPYPKSSQINSKCSKTGPKSCTVEQSQFQ